MEGIGPSPWDSTTHYQELEGKRVLILSIFSVVWPQHTHGSPRFVAYRHALLPCVVWPTAASSSNGNDAMSLLRS